MKMFLPTCIWTASLTLSFLSSPSPFSSAFLRLATTRCERAVDLRAQREADVVGEEDRDLLQLLPRHLLVVQDRVALNLEQFLHALGGHHRQRHHPLVAHRQARPGPDGAEEVVDGQREVLVALACSASPSRRPRSSSRGPSCAARPSLLLRGRCVCGTPRPAARFFSASSAKRQVHAGGLTERERQAQILLAEPAGVDERVRRGSCRAPAVCHVLADDDRARSAALRVGVPDHPAELLQVDPAASASFIASQAAA